MGSGVAGALRAEGGQELNEEAVSQGLIDLGAVAVTDAYDLDARWVIHAAAMPHHGDREATADELGAQSLVIPALGCGVAGFDLKQGARIICEIIESYDPSLLNSVSVIVYSGGEYETIQQVAADVQSGLEL